MTHNSHETKVILQRMEEVRRDLDIDVQEIVEGTRDLGDWRSYVKTYPWICVGVAAAVGYLLVPRRVLAMQPDAQMLAEFVKQSRLLATANSRPKVGARGALVSFAGNLVLRRVLSYVAQQADKFFAQQAAGSQQDDCHEEPHS